jgi:putative ABC transport system substrate-binding protein
MKRRTFIAALGGAAAWPRVARAQEGLKVWRIGYLSPSSATKPSVSFFDAFRIKLEELGYTEGKNLRLDVRRAEEDHARLPGLAAELVALRPDVIVASSTGAASALQRATSSIPIVMATSNDPIGNGLVRSLAKPGRNITGLSTFGFELTAKSLETLHVAVPNAKRIAVLMSPNVSHPSMLKEAYSAAETLGLTIIAVTAKTVPDLDDAFATMHREDCDALVVLSDGRIIQKTVELANKWRLPAIYQNIDFVDMGGLLSYAPNLQEMYREAAVYVDKILRGDNPADLPVEQPTRLELQVNLKTARAIGLTIPDSVLARADRVVE